MLSDLLKDKELFTSSEQMICNYILQHVDDIRSMSIDELAQKTFTSKATVVRFCKKLTDGKGFKEFKLDFLSEASEIRERNEKNSKLMSHFVDYQATEIIHDIYCMAESTARVMISEKQIDRISRTIFHSDYVDLFGTGLNLGYARETAYKLRRVEIFATALDDLYEYTLDVKHKKTVAILFGMQKTVEEVENMVRQLKERKYYVITFLSAENVDSDMLSKLGDECFNITTNIEMTQSIKSMLYELVLKYLLDVITIGVEKRGKTETNNSKTRLINNKNMKQNNRTLKIDFKRNSLML